VQHLLGVRGAVALEEEPLGHVARDRGRRVGRDLGGAMVAGGEHAEAAEDLEPLVVAVRGAPARVDLAQPAALGADRDRGRVGVAGGGDRRIGEAARRRVHADRLVAEDPPADIEVVDQHVLEDAARAADVLDRRRARIAAGHHQHLGLADLAGVEPALERGERRVVAALEPDHARDLGLGDRRGARARALEVEVDRLLAEDRLAGRRRAQDQVGVRIGARRDHDGIDAGVGEDPLEVAGGGAELRGEFVGGQRDGVAHEAQLHAGLAGQVGAVDLADPAGTDERDLNHLGSLVMWSREGARSALLEYGSFRYPPH